MAQPDPKCTACQRTTATHSPGCSVVACPHRRADVWDGPDGPRGFHGRLAEDRIVARMGERGRCVPVALSDL